MDYGHRLFIGIYRLNSFVNPFDLVFVDSVFHLIKGLSGPSIPTSPRLVGGRAPAAPIAVVRVIALPLQSPALSATAPTLG